MGEHRIWGKTNTRGTPTKKNLSESDLDDKITEFPKFIVIEYTFPLAKLLPFLIDWMNDLQLSEPTNCEKKKPHYTLKVDNKKHAENKAYPYKRLNTLKGVIRNRELSLTTPDGIKIVMG